ncbi:unnamed protein product [Lota lota]
MQDYEGTHQHVYMVDTHANCPPVPHRSVPPKPLPPTPSPPPHGTWSCQALVIILLFLMICGMTIQAVFLYRIYYPTTDADSPSASKMTLDKGCASPTTKPLSTPSKPIAHLTDGYNIHHGKEIMSWSTDGDSFLREMKYKDGQLFVKKEGFYFIYSKVFFMESAMFDHSVRLRTRTYQHKAIELLKARKYSPRSHLPAKSNSYLGGVFHLKKGDTIFVQVNSTSQILQFLASENFFGAYMI